MNTPADCENTETPTRLSDVVHRQALLNRLRLYTVTKLGHKRMRDDDTYTVLETLK